jgi:hypothetical protein
VKLTSEHHPVLRLRKSGAMPLLHKHTLSLNPPFKPLKHPLFVKNKKLKIFTAILLREIITVPVITKHALRQTPTPQQGQPSATKCTEY